MRRLNLAPAILAGFAACLTTAAAPQALAQDWRGVGRIQGSVVDESGQPIQGATLKAHCAERGGGTTITTNKKGEWVLGGVVGCNWAFDVSAPGYETLQIAIRLPGESARLAPVKIPLKAAKAAAGGASPELQALAAQADAAYKEGRYAEARAEYEKLLAARPDLATAVHQQVGFTYIQEKQYAKAVESLEQVLAAEPGNAQVRAIAAQAALEGRMVDKGRTLLSGLDETQIQSADVFFNMGINFFNAGESKDAVQYFGKAIAKDPAHVDAYYRRALGYLGLGQMAEAKADFQKVVELQPDGEMGAAAKKALESLK
jgi:tetratricopeptide (TPR) repeat protein